MSAGVPGFPGTDYFALGVRVSGRRGRRSFLEGGLDWTDALHTRQRPDQIVWFYFWQMKHTLWTDGRTSVFATYGTSGWAERTTARADPGDLELSAIEPLVPLVGAGTQHVIASRLAIRLEGQLLIWQFESGTFIARVGVGVTIPVHRYERR